MALPLFEKDMNIISKLSHEPNSSKNEGLDGDQLKDKFDEGGEALKEYINGTLLPYLEGVQAAASLGIATISGISGATNVQAALEALKQAIDNTSAGAIPDASLGGGKLIAKTITAREMADGSIGENALINGAVAEQKVADNGITKEKLADRSVEARHLNKQIISDEHIADNSIDASGKLKSGSLAAKLFAAQSVGETAIVDGAVTGEKIAAGAVSGLYAVVIPTSGWQKYNNSDSNVYYLDMAVSGVKAADRGDLMLQRGIASDFTDYTVSAFETDIEKLSHIVAANITADNTLRLFADEIPSGSIYCFLRVVKK